MHSVSVLMWASIFQSVAVIASGHSTGHRYAIGNYRQSLDTGTCSPNCGQPSPILVPLVPDAEQYKLTSRTNGVRFDLNADGVKEQIAWTAADSRLAFLAIDRNGNGKIDDGRELFGSVTRPDSANGFEALAKLKEETGDDISYAATWDGDSLFGSLLLWEDRNHNGMSEPSELQQASNVLKAIGFGYHTIKRRDEYGNLLNMAGWAFFADDIQTYEPRLHHSMQDKQRSIIDVSLTSTR